MAAAPSGSPLPGVAHCGPLPRLGGLARTGSLAPPCVPPLRFAVFPPGARRDSVLPSPVPPPSGRKGAANEGARATPQAGSRHPALSPPGCARMERPTVRLHLPLVIGSVQLCKEGPSRIASLQFITWNGILPFSAKRK
ncbi:basic proline-rich protein-like [Choloepus didactylus]|uniref:basic proline-rich protein-like n=1 Tax=Choloepus didactylus TaxID=27675 RepID=UPI0018A0BC3E|nr:basic proline-rich protein-like [Choloepus didactylus]XP_037684929.1 basic proline-rich protein-like [Choloepus didactylus]